MIDFIDVGRDEAACAQAAINAERIERRKDILIKRWFLSWRLRKRMPDIAAKLQPLLKQEFERRARAALNAEWQK